MIEYKVGDQVIITATQEQLDRISLSRCIPYREVYTIMEEPYKKGRTHKWCVHVEGKGISGFMLGWIWVDWIEPANGIKHLVWR